MASNTSSQFGPRAALAAVVPVAFVLVLLLVKGFTLGTIAMSAVFMAPILLYIALKWPLEVLFGLYALLVPFDNLLSTGSFGTLTKLLGIVAGAFLLLRVVRSGRFSIESAPVRVLALLFLWMFASMLWAIDEKPALQMIQTFAGLMLLYAVVSMIPISQKQLQTLLVLTVAGGVAAAAYGAHAFYQTPVFSGGASALQRLVVHVGQFDIDPNHFADALILPVAITGMWCLRARSFVARIGCALPLGVLLYAILLSGSREAVIALGLIAVYYLWRSRYRVRLAIGLVGIGVLASAVRSSVFERFSTALQTGGSGRADIWAVALETAKHRPLQGYGIGNFSDAYNLFYLSVPQAYPFGWDSPAHNLALHYLVEIGIVGLALIAWFFVAQFRSLRTIGSADRLYDYRIVSEASLAAIVVVSLAIDLFQYKYAWLVFAVAALLRTAAASHQHSAEMRPASPAMMSSRFARDSRHFRPLSPSSRSAILSSADS